MRTLLRRIGVDLLWLLGAVLLAVAWHFTVTDAGHTGTAWSLAYGAVATLYFLTYGVAHARRRRRDLPAPEGFDLEEWAERQSLGVFEHTVGAGQHNRRIR